MITVTKEMLKAEREKAGFTVKATAEYLGVSMATIYAYECGKSNIPATRQEQIREMFDISDESIDRYPETKTEEGYPDPTAAEALKEHKKVEINTPQVGKIYEVPTNDKNKTRALLVLSVSEKCVTGCMVYTRPWKCSYPEMTYTSGRFVVDISEIRRFAISSLNMHRYFDMPEMWKDVNRIKEKIAARLSIMIQPVKVVEEPLPIVEEKPVEKVIYKEVTDPLKEAVFTVYNDILSRLGGK